MIFVARSVLVWTRALLGFADLQLISIPQVAEELLNLAHAQIRVVAKSPLGRAGRPNREAANPALGQPGLDNVDATVPTEDIGPIDFVLNRLPDGLSVVYHAGS